MMRAKSEFGDGDFAGAGGGGARPRSHADVFDSTAREGVEVEKGGCASVDKKAHFGGADANFDNGEAVAPFDGDLVRRGSGLCEKRSREKRKAHDEDSS